MSFNPKKIRECFRSLTTFSNWTFLGILITASGYFLFKQTEKRIIQQTVAGPGEAIKNPISSVQKLEPPGVIASASKLSSPPRT